MLRPSVLRHPFVRFAVGVIFVTAALLMEWGKPGPVVHLNGINIGYEGQSPVQLGEAIAVLLYAFGGGLTVWDAHLFLGTLSLPVWPAVASVIAGLLLKGLTTWRDNRPAGLIGNVLLVMGFLAGLLVAALLSASAGRIGPGVLFLMAAAVIGLMIGPSRPPDGIENKSMGEPP